MANRKENATIFNVKDFKDKINEMDASALIGIIEDNVDENFVKRSLNKDSLVVIYNALFMWKDLLMKL